MVLSLSEIVYGETVVLSVAIDSAEWWEDASLRVGEAVETRWPERG